MNYLQFFADYAPYLEPFDDAERGRLLTAMLAYAFDGTEPEFAGNERFIWPVFRKMIDQSRAALEKKQAAGRASRAADSEADGSTPEQTEAEPSTIEHGEADGSTPEQTEAEPSTIEHGEADGSTPEQTEANGHIKQESRYKNQETRDKNQTPKDKKQGSEPKTGGIHTHPGTATSRPRARMGPPDPGGFVKPWFDPEDPDADCDDAWRTSEKARAAVAQRIIDYVSADYRGNPNAGEPYPDLLGLMCRLMKKGMHPAVILECGLQNPSWRHFVVELLHAAARNAEWRSGPYPEEYGRFLPPDTLRKYGILPQKEGAVP